MISFRREQSIPAIMALLGDCFGNSIKLTSERLLHIVEHPKWWEWNWKYGLLCVVRRL
jgi:hypothetical protein